MRRLVRTRPGDTVIAVAHLQTLEMPGKAGEAIAEAESLWYLRHSMPGDALAIYVTQLGNLAMYERATEVFDLVN
jgi:hypothetical protein